MCSTGVAAGPCGAVEAGGVTGVEAGAAGVRTSGVMRVNLTPFAGTTLWRLRRRQSMAGGGGSAGGMEWEGCMCC